MTKATIQAARFPGPGHWYERLFGSMPANGFDRNNVIGTFLVGALPAVAGSVISVLLNAFFVWAIISLLVRRFRFRMTGDDRILAAVLSIYALSILGTALLADRRVALLQSTFWLLPYFSAWVLLPRLRASPDVDFLLVFCLGASVGAIAGSLVGVAELLFGQIRPEAATGNPAIYGVMCLLMAVLGALNVSSERPLARSLAIAGLFAGLFGLLISQTRGTWIAAIPALAITFGYAPSAWLRLFRNPRMAWVLVIGLAVFFFAGDAISYRVTNARSELETLFEGGSSALGIGERLKLWQAALGAIAESPVWGYGIQNRMLAIQPFYVSTDTGVATYTHPHNLLLTAMLDGGIIVAVALLALLAVPVFTAKQSAGSEPGRKRLYFAILLITIYAVNGMTQIMFKHDIMDSFFIYSVLILAVAQPWKGRGQTPA